MSSTRGRSARHLRTERSWSGCGERYGDEFDECEDGLEEEDASKRVELDVERLSDSRMTLSKRKLQDMIFLLSKSENLRHSKMTN